MDSELTHYEIKSNAIINQDNASLFASGGGETSQQQQQQQFSAPSLAPPSMSLATPLMGTSAESQVMSNYISSSNTDLPNQYNIILAEDEESCGQPLDSPASPPLVPATAVPYRSYTVQFKLDALNWYYKNGENKNLTAKMFNIDRKRIRDWLQDEPNLRSDPTPERTKRKRSNSLPQFKEIETALYQYYCEQVEKGLKPKNTELRAKGLEFAAKFGYQNSFKASVHWLCNWKRRNKISVLHSEPSNEEDDDGSVTTPTITETQFGELDGQHQGGVKQASLGDMMGNGSSSGIPGRGNHSNMDGVGHHVGSHSQQDQVEEIRPRGMTRAETATHSSIDQSTCEQWVDLVEQTVLSLETDVNKKLNQIKLLLQQIKSSLHPQSKPPMTPQFHHSSSSSPTPPQAQQNSMHPHFPRTPSSTVTPIQAQHNSIPNNPPGHSHYSPQASLQAQYNSISPHYPHTSATTTLPPGQHNSINPHFPHTSPAPLTLAPRTQISKH